MDFDLSRVERTIGAQVVRSLVLEQRVEELEAENAALRQQAVADATKAAAAVATAENGKPAEAKAHATRTP
jgi:hypothetical protein